MAHYLVIPLIILISLAKVLTREPFQLTENQISSISLQAEEEYLYYLPISPNQAGYTLIIPFLAPTNPNITLYMSNNTNQYPLICSNPLQNPDKSCYLNLIDDFNPLDIQYLYIKVLCISQNCTIKLKNIISSKITLEFYHPEYENFNLENPCQIIEFNLPTINTYDRVILKIHSHNYDTHNLFSNSSLSNFLRISSNISLISYLPDKILVLFLTKDLFICNDCNISLLICSEGNLMLEFLVQGFKEQMELFLGDDYIDYIEKPDLMNLYKVKLDKEHWLKNSLNRLFFMLTTLTGSTKALFVNGDYQPRDTKDYFYNSSLMDFYQEEDIVIEKDDIELSGFKGEEFYLLVKSNIPGFFKLHIIETNSLITPISLGMSETRSIKSGELHYYRLMIWSYAVKDGILLIKATIESGNIEVFGRQCSSNEDCPLITEAEIEGRTLEYQSDIKKGNKMLKVPSKCKDNETYCYLNLVIKGYNSTFLGLNRYSLLITRENYIINLIENNLHDSHIELNSKIRYKLSINDPEHLITSIKFTLNVDIPYYVTKETLCFEPECAERVGSSRNPVLFKNQDFTGDYFLFVDGLKSSDFSIYPEVIRKGVPTKEIPLQEGKAYKGILNEENPEISFYFIVNQEEETDIEVILQGAKGKFSIELYNGKKGGFGWISSTNLLEIKHLKSANNLYRLVIKPNEINLKGILLNFVVLYATEKTLKVIEKNKVFYDTLKPNLFKDYMFYFDVNEDSCIITRHIINPSYLAENLSLYITSKPFSEGNSSVYQGQDLETSRIELKNEDFSNLCANNVNLHHCPIYIRLFNNNSKEDIVYSLLVHFRNKAIEIYEGIEQRFTINHKEEVIRGYYLPNNPNSTIDLNFYTENEKFEVFLSIYADKDNLALSKQFLGNFPNKTSYNFYSHENFMQNLVIKPKRLEFCWPACVILFTITYNLKFKDFASLSVVISTNYMEINEGKPYMFSLVANQFKYFYYNLASLLKNNDLSNETTLFLTLTSYYGSANMFISITNNLNNENPTDNNADYYAYESYFSINKEEILNGLEGYTLNVKKLFNTAKMVIGVFSKENEGKFMLNLMKSDNILIRLYQGSPLEFFIRNGSQVFYQYYFGFNEKFKVIINRENGAGVFGVVACSFDSMSEDSEVFKTCTKKPETRFEIIAGTGSGFFEINQKNIGKFCVDCYYLIHLKSLGGDFKGSLIIKEDDYTLLSLQEGHKFYDHLNRKEENRFVFWSSSVDIIEVLVTVFQGDPRVYYSPEYTDKKDGYKENFTKNSNNLIQFYLSPRETPLNEWEISDIYGQYKNNYLLVASDNHIAEYSISYIIKRSHLLQGGLIHFDSVKPMDTKGYIFNQIDNQPVILTISFDKNINFTEDCKINTAFRESNEKIGFQSREIEDISLETSFQSLQTIAFKLPSNKQGTYFFNLTYQKVDIDKRPLNYSIVFNSREITVIPYDVTIKAFIPKESLRFYEVYVPYEGFLALELLECMGHLELLITKDYHKLLLEEFDEDFKPVIGQSMLQVMKIQPGMIYFAIKTGLESSIFDFSLGLYSKYTEIPQIRFSFMNQGRLNYEYNQNNKEFEISFEGLICELCEEKELLQFKLEYFLIISEDLISLSAKGKCGVFELNSNKSIIDYEVSTMNIGELSVNNRIMVKKQLDSEKIHYVTVKARITKENGRFIELFYPILEIPPVKSHHKLAFYVISSLITVIIITSCVLAAIYYRKYRGVMKKLRYEMEDVRNIAQLTGVNTSIEMENKKYQGLSDKTDINE